MFGVKVFVGFTLINDMLFSHENDALDFAGEQQDLGRSVKCDWF